MAAIQTSTGSIHTLQQTLTSQRRELAELRKLVNLRHDTLEDSTEIEYLRNILFEYMMGRETMVLARVIAAVVKFDQEQTAKILKKEEDKLTLVSATARSTSLYVAYVHDIYVSNIRAGFFSVWLAWSLVVRDVQLSCTERFYRQLTRFSVRITLCFYRPLIASYIFGYIYNEENENLYKLATVCNIYRFL